MKTYKNLSHQLKRGGQHHSHPLTPVEHRDNPNNHHQPKNEEKKNNASQENSVNNERPKSATKKFNFDRRKFIYLMSAVTTCLVAGGAIGGIAGGLLGTQKASSTNLNMTCSDTQKCPNNASCINSTCVCDPGYYAVTSVSCGKKKTYQERCSSNTECDDTNLLYCPPFHGACTCPVPSLAYFCDCPITHFWDNNTKTCFQRRTYNQPCVPGLSYMCLANIGLNCTGNCSCDYTHYWDGLQCVPKKFNGSCSNTTECQDYLNPPVTCVGGQCMCPLPNYFGYNYTCIRTKTYQEACVMNIECNSTKGLYCPQVNGSLCNCPNASLANYCDCNNTNYWDTTALTCVPRKSYNQNCSATYQCIGGLNFTCNASICTCAYTDYFDGTQCVPKMFNGTCNFTYQCQNYLTPPVSCVANQCSCPNIYYPSFFPSTQCVLKMFNGTCNATYQCQDYQTPPVTCVANQCWCPVTHYPHSSNTCQLKKTYQVTCAADIECNNQTGLICQTTANACNCPTTSTVSKCDCNSTAYWDTSALTCYARKPYGSTCVTGAHYQCVSGFNFICNTTCTCPYTHWYNGSHCIVKIFNGSCSATQECQDYLSPPVTCVANQCWCPVTHYPYTNSTCQTKKTYQVTCAADIECNNQTGLICQTTANACNCPTVSTASKCDCNSTAYWDTTTLKCYARKPYGATCLTGAHYQCVSGFGYICNNTCTCPYNYWYNGSYCILKIFNGTCSATQECTDYLSPPVTCVANQCWCPVTHYPYTNSTCQTKKTYQIACTADIECNNQTGLFCQTTANACNCPTASTANTCDCKSTFYWTGSACAARKPYGSSCTSGNTYECISGLNMICNGNCTCPPTHYWNGSICLVKKLYTISCAGSFECDDNKNLSCYSSPNNCSCPITNVANTCDCVPTSYWNGSFCVPRKVYGSSCTNGNTYECQTGKNMTCTGTCTCPSTHYWTGTTCALLKTYVASCFNSTECDASIGLSCYSASNGCNCPTTSQANRCDCVATSFWNGTRCTPRIAYGSSCTNGNTYECQTGRSMICTGNCTCPTTHYWTGTTCAILRSYASTCFNSTECDVSKSLTCNSTSTNCNCPTTSTALMCDCAITQYWNTTHCVTRIPYGGSCTNGATYQCEAGKNMTCTGTCTCPTTHYWTGSTCALLKTYTAACFNSTECDASKTLLCYATSNNCNCPTTSQAGTCDCVATSYWTGSTCTPRKAYGSACTNGNTYECVTGKNLTCTGTCTCPTTHYWTGTTCALLKTYTAACFNSTECDASKSLYCPAASNGCNCPTTSIANMCDCVATSYWTGSTCTPRKPYGTTCGNLYECQTGKNFICSTTCTCASTDYWTGSTCATLKTYTNGCFNNTECAASKGLSCYATANGCNCPTTSVNGMCDCATTNYWSAASNACLTRRSYGQTCTSGNHYECTINANMVCTGTCTCPSGTYWTGSSCAPVKTYTASCTSSVECDSTKGLTCPSSSTSCNCPSTSSALICDCAITQYWDGTKCTSRVGYGSSCSATYMCTANLNMICSTTCRCPTGFYWTGSSCAAVKTYTASCASSVECDSTKGLSCYTGTASTSSCPITSAVNTCDCASTSYWTGSTCTSKLPYSTACTSTCQCTSGLSLICNTTCTCPYTHYWTGATCAAKKPSGSTCASTIECQTYLSPPLSCNGGLCGLAGGNPTLLFFQPYKTTSVKTYNGNTFVRPTNIVAVFSSQVYYYITDWNNGVLVIYDQNTNYVRHFAIYWCQMVTQANNQFIYTMNNNLLVTKWDLNVNMIGQISYSSAFFVHYAHSLNTLYNSNSGSPIYNLYNINLGYLGTITTGYYGYGTTSWNGRVYFLYGTTIYVLSGSSVVAAYANSCGTADTAYGITNEANGYLFVSCYGQRRIYLWHANGTFFNRFLLTTGNPMGITVDALGRLASSLQGSAGLDLFSI